MSFYKKGIRAGALCLMIIVCLYGCGRFSFPGTRAGGDIKKQLSDFEIGLTEGSQTESYEMQEGTCLYGARSHTYADTLEGENLEEYQQSLTAMGVTIGDSMEKVLELPAMTENYASLQYEYDIAGNGETYTQTETYTGTMINLDQLNCLECMVTFAWYLDGEEWIPLDFANDDILNHTQVMTIAFDIQGPAAEYGVEEGQICGIFCEYY